MYVCMYVWMDGWMDVWMYGCMDVYIYICVYIYVYIYILCMYIVYILYIYIYTYPSKCIDGDIYIYRERGFKNCSKRLHKPFKNNNNREETSQIVEISRNNHCI